MVVVLRQDENLAILLVGEVLALHQLVAPPLHRDALTVVARELVLLASCQLEKLVGSCPILASVLLDSPLSLSQNKRLFSGKG